jgi:hypothetical protein
MGSFKLPRLFLTLVALSASSAIAAPVVNGGFETGNLGGWSSVITNGITVQTISHPTVAMPFAGSAYSPLDGQYSALLVTMSSASTNSPYGGCFRDVWNLGCPQPLPFVGGGGTVPSHPIVPFGGAIALWATIISQDVTIQAGQTLRWNWELFGEAACGIANPGRCIDNGWMFASDGVATQFLYAPRSGSASSATAEFHRSGNWSIYFGVGQTEDPQFYSALMVDSVRVVSTPGSLGLSGAGLLAMVWVRRHQASTSLRP